MSFLERLLENPRKFAVIRKLFFAALVIIVLAEIAVSLLHLGHGHFFFEELPAYGSVFGLLSCVIIIIISKVISQYWLTKKEDYYD